MSILGYCSTSGWVRGKKLQVLSVLSMTVLFLSMTTSHYNQIYATQGGVEKVLSNGHNTPVRSAKTKIKEGHWNAPNQTVGMQGFSNVKHNGKVYSVWWQIGRGTNDGGNPRVIAKIGFSEIGDPRRYPKLRNIPTMLATTTSSRSIQKAMEKLTLSLAILPKR